MKNRYFNATSATGLWPEHLRSVFCGLWPEQLRRKLRIPDLMDVPTNSGEVPMHVWEAVSSGYTHCGRLVIRTYVWDQMGRDYSKQHINNWMRRCYDFLIPGP